MENTEQHKALVQKAIAELKLFQVQYAELTELSELFEEIDALAGIERFIGSEEVA